MPTYFLADAARILGLFNELKSLNESCMCLYSGKSEQNLAIVAPYIFKYPFSAEFSNYLLKKGWGNSWGVYTKTEETKENIHHHFRKFLLVKTEDEKQIYFRFYDPRVLRLFLPTCNVEQLKEFFGPIQQFICEDEDPVFALIFSLDGTKLITERANAESFFSSYNKIDNEILPSTRDNKNADNIIQQQKKPPRRFFVD